MQNPILSCLKASSVSPESSISFFIKSMTAVTSKRAMSQFGGGEVPLMSYGNTLNFLLSQTKSKHKKKIYIYLCLIDKIQWPYMPRPVKNILMYYRQTYSMCVFVAVVLETE